MKGTPSTAITPANISAVVGQLAETPRSLRRLGAGLSEEQRREPLGSDERSFVQTLAHLVNCEAVDSEAIYLALMLDAPLLAGVHPERQLGKLLRYDLLPSSDLLQYFSLRRRTLLRVLGLLAQKDWSRAVRQSGKQREESVYWKARTLALHELEHLQDLERKLSRNPPAV
jgi:hypothetical protein